MESKHTLIVPDWFDADPLVQKFNRNDKRNNMKDALLYIINYIFVYQYKFLDDYAERGGAPINSTQLRKYVGCRNAKEAIDILVENGYIELAKEYIAGTKSRIYTFNPNYKIHQTKEVNTVGDILEPNIKRVEMEDTENVCKKLPHLTKYLLSPKLEIDWKAANYWIFKIDYELAKLILIEENKAGSITESIKKLRKIKNLRLINAHMNISKLANRGISFKLSKSNLRLNTSFTQLLKTTRNFIKYDGENLIEIDINASQPRILRYILETIELKKLNNNNNKSIVYKQLNIITKNNSNIYHMLCTLIDPEKLSKEVIEFSNLFNGDFYDNIMSLINSKHGKIHSDFKTRNKTKSSIIYLLFETFKGGKENRPVYQAFKNIFPEILKVIDTIKSDNRNTLALLLQRIEAVIMLENVTYVIAQEMPEAPMLTIHDSILTTPSNVIQMKGIMERELNQILNQQVVINENTLTENVNQMEDTHVQKEFETILEKAKRKKKNLNYEEILTIQLINNCRPKWKDKSMFTMLFNEQLSKVEIPDYEDYLDEFDPELKKYLQEQFANWDG